MITVNTSLRSQSNAALVPSVQSKDNDYTKIKRTILLQSVASANGAEQALNDWLLVEVTRLVIEQYTLMNVLSHQENKTVETSDTFYEHLNKEEPTIQPNNHTLTHRIIHVALLIRIG